MRFPQITIAVLLIATSFTCAAVTPSPEAGSRQKWLSEAIDRGAKGAVTLPKRDVDSCVASLRSASKAIQNAVAVMPIDLSRPTLVMYVVGQGFESASVSAIGSDKSGKHLIAFDDLSSQEQQSLSDASVNKVERLALSTMRGEIKSMADVQDGECVLLVRKDEARLFPPGYGAPRGPDDALHLLKLAINDAFSASTDTSPP